MDSSGGRSGRASLGVGTRAPRRVGRGGDARGGGAGEPRRGACDHTGERAPVYPARVLCSSGGAVLAPGGCELVWRGRMGPG